MEYFSQGLVFTGLVCVQPLPKFSLVFIAIVGSVSGMLRLLQVLSYFCAEGIYENLFK